MCKTHCLQCIVGGSHVVQKHACSACWLQNSLPAVHCWWLHVGHVSGHVQKLIACSALLVATCRSCEWACAKLIACSALLVATCRSCEWACAKLIACSALLVATCRSCEWACTKLIACSALLVATCRSCEWACTKTHCLQCIVGGYM